MHETISLNNGEDIRLLWVSLKIEIRDHTKAYCKNKSKLTKVETRNLEEELELKLKLRDELTIENKTLNDSINNIEQRLEVIYKNKAKGAQIRSGERWVELGEKNNSYFLGLAKKGQAKKCIKELKKQDSDSLVFRRFIGFNLRQIQDIKDYADLYDVEWAIVFVDFTKAFDSLEWDFMFTVLKHFGFNDSFISWVETIYNGIQTCVLNNGWLSEVFNDTRGIYPRQGCPLSALLFVMSVEIMALRIRDNRSMKG